MLFRSAAVQAQDLIRLHQLPLAAAAGLGVGPCVAVDEAIERRLGLGLAGEGNGHLAALLGDVVRRGPVVIAIGNPPLLPPS